MSVYLHHISTCLRYTLVEPDRDRPLRSEQKNIQLLVHASVTIQTSSPTQYFPAVVCNNFSSPVQKDGSYLNIIIKPVCIHLGILSLSNV